MRSIDTLFDRMDAWRHLPSYQLERRADLFFSLYLPEVLEARADPDPLLFGVERFPAISAGLHLQRFGEIFERPSGHFALRQPCSTRSRAKATRSWSPSGVNAMLLTPSSSR